MTSKTFVLVAAVLLVGSVGPALAEYSCNCGPNTNVFLPTPVIVVVQTSHPR